jgi:hypothetical protein
MLEMNKDSCGSSQQRSGALSRWDNEGGAGPTGPQQSLTLIGKQSDVPPLTDVEIMQLRVRVIALENLVIALLAHSSDHVQLTAREMADYILPKPGATQHRLTTHAATHMIDLLERSKHFRNV